MKPEIFSQHHIRCALVTGACSGIGFQFARLLSAAGVEVVMVSNNDERLQQAVATLRLDPSEVHPVCLDLSKPESALRLFDLCREEGWEVDLLVNNAGIFFFRDVCDTSVPMLQTMIGLHVQTPVLLCRLFGFQMGQRHRGYILNISSMASWMAFPGIAMYSATKVFMRDFSGALFHELRERGVQLTVVCPGGIDTALFGLSPRLRRLGVRLGILMTPERLVERSIKALLAGKRRIVPGAVNKLFIPLARILPGWMVRFLRHRLRSWTQPTDKPKEHPISGT